MPLLRSISIASPSMHAGHDEGLRPDDSQRQVFFQPSGGPVVVVASAHTLLYIIHDVARRPTVMSMSTWRRKAEFNIASFAA